MSKKVIGIDLGTGNSCMSVFENGSVKVIPNAEGNNTTPSIVAFTKSGERLVGAAAKRQAITNPKNTIHSVKRLIGRKFSEVKDLVKLMSYDIVEGKNGDAAIKIGDKIYTPEEISSMVLAKLKADAEAFLGEKITDAVITVPAYFNNEQRKSTQNAGTIAGFNVLRIINEPTAAALAYGIDKTNEDKVVAIVDCGQGTTDFSILDCSDGVFEVLSTNGDSLLGGKDIDEAIVKFVAEKFKKENGVDLMKDSQALQRLTESAEKAKCELSTTNSSELNIPFITMNQDGPIHLNETLTRATLEQIISSVYDKAKIPCETCIKDSGKDKSKIDDVLMVGGTTRIPYIQNMAKEIFGKDVNKNINPDECVSAGAAIQGAVLAGDKSTGDVVLLDVTPLTLSIETMGEVATHMIEKNTTIPTKKTETFSTAADGQSAVTIRICQGERERFADNKLLGTFNLDGIAPAPRGVPQIEVTFDLDANGILTVSAKDKGTGKEQHITIESKGGLSKEEIDRMIKEAELHAEEDKKFKEDQTVLNQADSLIFNLEKQMKDNADKIPEDLKTSLTPKLEELKKAKESKDIEKIKTIMNDLQQEAMKIGEAIYKQQQANSTPPPTSDNTNSNAGPDVVDAEVVD